MEHMEEDFPEIQQITVTTYTELNHQIAQVVFGKVPCTEGWEPYRSLSPAYLQGECSHPEQSVSCYPADLPVDYATGAFAINDLIDYVLNCSQGQARTFQHIREYYAGNILDHSVAFRFFPEHITIGHIHSLFGVAVCKAVLEVKEHGLI